MMEPNEIIEGRYYRHVGSGVVYVVIGKGSMKLPSGEWVDAVFYQPKGVPMNYCRSAKSFVGRFLPAGVVVEVTE